MAPADVKDASPPPRPPPPPAGPALPGGAEEYVRGSIEAALGLPVPDRSIRAKLAAYEDLRRRLQDRVFALEEDLHAAARRIDLLKNESAMNAEGIRRCVEEKEAVAAARDQLAAHAARLEKECGLYERDLERAMESCDELARESDDLRNRLRDAPDLTEQVQALQRDKEILKTNLNKAEEEVKLLFEENRALDEANKRLLCLLEKEQKHRSERKHSASNSTKQKRKSSSLKDTSPVSLAIDFNSADASRQPLLPLQPNSPDCRVHKK
ncbi:uncharacterized protein [Aegilops tauschii subsp. strangulata]|uniref:uncharacterized protein isoform X1 n=1 Tax=Aegilops tauschii subsp. strangulata TaxID=200361 RepID=UPI000842B765|nr:LOW QUALITY PROTEIN: leucine zipper putative tumor suppressor 2 [Aegilops tauschii subsp. strangulata]XP_044417190.1 leucine zipper putative tumor suppressor 2-like isoform X1 [Triticum aestivum]